jgi:hypothetical protein
VVSAHQQAGRVATTEPGRTSKGGAFLVEACRQLGDELVKAWHLHNLVPRLPPDEDEVLHARRLIAQRCLYGVDKNAMAVDLAKLSLWLATLAKDHPFTFLDHALRAGDSLVGLGQQEILRFHWKPGEKQMLTGRSDPPRRAGTDWECGCLTGRTFRCSVGSGIMEARDAVFQPSRRGRFAGEPIERRLSG